MQKINSNISLTLPIQYHLYQLYTSEGNLTKANQYKNSILTNYPNTQFAQIIQNPNTKLQQEASVDKTEKTYKEVYYLYKKDKFKEVITRIDAVLPKIQGTVLAPKFELLKAFSIGKIKGKKTYKKAMEFVALHYANTEEGKRAKEITQQLE